MAEDPSTDEPVSCSRKVFVSVVSVLVLGLSQLLAWLGQGVAVPGGSGVTVLQLTAFVSFLIQFVVFLPAYWFQTERYYDITGTFTYLTCVSLTLGLGFEGAKATNGGRVDERAIAASCMIFVWAIRLGSFLFARIQNSSDPRFEKLMPSAPVFLMVWFIQGLWVFLTAMPVYVLNSTQSRAYPNTLLWSDVVGPALFVVGFLIEVLADREKAEFRANSMNKTKFIDTGLWRFSRHPNYFGEWVLHAGIFLFCTAELTGSQWVCVASPVFVAILLRFVSGVPLLEKKSDAKFQGREDWAKYKATTSVCVIMPKFAEGGCCGKELFV